MFKNKTFAYLIIVFVVVHSSLSAVVSSILLRHPDTEKCVVVYGMFHDPELAQDSLNDAETLIETMQLLNETMFNGGLERRSSSFFIECYGKDKPKTTSRGIDANWIVLHTDHLKKKDGDDSFGFDVVPSDIQELQSDLPATCIIRVINACDEGCEFPETFHEFCEKYPKHSLGGQLFEYPLGQFFDEHLDEMIAIATEHAARVSGVCPAINQRVELLDTRIQAFKDLLADSVGGDLGVHLYVALKNYLYQEGTEPAAQARSLDNMFITGIDCCFADIGFLTKLLEDQAQEQATLSMALVGNVHALAIKDFLVQEQGYVIDERVTYITPTPVFGETLSLEQDPSQPDYKLGTLVLPYAGWPDFFERELEGVLGA